jgi:hypothetical protein
MARVARLSSPNHSPTKGIFTMATNKTQKQKESRYQACARVALIVADFCETYEDELKGDVALHAQGLLDALVGELNPQNSIAEARMCVSSFAAYWDRQLHESSPASAATQSA